MGTYGTATGIVLWFNPDTGYGELMNLVDGETVLLLSGPNMTLSGELTLELGGKLIWDDGVSRLDVNGMHLQGYLYHYEPNSTPEVLLVSKYAARASLGVGNYASLYTEAIYGHNDGVNFYATKRIELYHGGSLSRRYTFSRDGLDLYNERITSVGNAFISTDALNLQTGDGRYATLASGRRWRKWFEA